ncbi:MAG: hypothetical protein P4L46_23945 [Fimbriimonas sp.]|nr:hypothetical protein [Fimbriimonas sp.]
MTERLYSLLPEIYRTLDYQKNEPLRALLQVLESEYNVVSQDIGRLYGDWFIETCDEWVVPYIADLLGIKGVRADGSVSLRAYVANTIGYRRRKGTALVIEEIARDLFAHPAKVQEFEFLLAHTQHMNHLRLDRLATMEIRSADICREVDTAFDQSMHLAEVGLIETGQAYFNQPNIGVSVWRVESHAVERGNAFKLAPNQFTFDPFGRTIPIYSPQMPPLDSFEPTTEKDVVEPLSARIMDNELRAIRAGVPELDGVYFGNNPVFEIYLNGSPTSVDPTNIYVADLSVFRAPPPPVNPGDPILVAVDPKLGLIATQTGVVNTVKVSYHFGTPGKIGGGYASSDVDLSTPLEEVFSVTSIAEIQQAFLNWDSLSYPNLRLTLDTSDTLTGTIVLSGTNTNIVLEAGANQRPALIGNIQTNAGSCPASVTVRGLWIKGHVQTAKPLKSLAIHDVTLVVTGSPSIVTADDSEDLEIDVQRCKLGACHLDSAIVGASFSNSVIHRLNGISISDRLGGSGPALTLNRCTVFGEVRVKEVDLCSESIVIGLVNADRIQTGCVRFSWLPLASRAPRRFYCQPNLEVDSLKAKNPSWPATQLSTAATLATYPRLESKDPDAVAYAQLGKGCPAAVAKGAENEGEMGVWNFLNEQERISNFLNAMDEYLRFGLEVGLIKRT